MPLYEYRCEKCGRQFEVIQKFSDAPLTACETCGGRVERMISSPAFQFKGTGWYVTDYARAGSKKDEGKEEKSATDTKASDGKQDGGKADETKPAETKTTPAASSGSKAS